jgi:hypothetical protein
MEPHHPSAEAHALVTVVGGLSVPPYHNYSWSLGGWWPGHHAALQQQPSPTPLSAGDTPREVKAHDADREMVYSKEDEQQ